VGTPVLRQTLKSRVGLPLHRSAQESKAEPRAKNGEKAVFNRCRNAVPGNRDGKCSILWTAYGPIRKQQIHSTERWWGGCYFSISSALLATISIISARSAEVHPEKHKQTAMKKLLLAGVVALLLATGAAHAVRPAHSADALDRIFAEQFNKKRAIGRCEAELLKYELMMDLAPHVDIGNRNHKVAFFFTSCMKGEGYQYNYEPRFPMIKNQSCGELREKNYGVPETLDACWEKLP